MSGERVLLYGGNPRSVTEGAPGSGISTCMGETGAVLRDLGYEVHVMDLGARFGDAPPEKLDGGWTYHRFRGPKSVERAARAGAWDAALTFGGWPFPGEAPVPTGSYAWFHPPHFGGRMIAAARMSLPQPAWKVAPAVLHSMWINAKPWFADERRFRESRRVLAVTEALARALDARVGSRVRYQPPPIDGARFRPGPGPVERARADSRLAIGFLGDTKSRQKGFPVLAEALVHLSHRVRDLRSRVRLVALTGGESEFLARARDAVDVETLPRRPRAELVSFYRALDLYVHPAVYEEFGYALVEAAASGAPCLAADTHSAREILGRTDLPRAGDPRAMARALEAWLDDPTDARWAARERALARYGREAVAPALKRNVQELVEASGTPS